MSIVAEWKNTQFALPLCNPMAFHRTTASSLGLEQSCICMNPSDTLPGDVSCADVQWDEQSDTCSACNSAPAWRLTNGPTHLEWLTHDEITGSCLYSGTAYELNVASGVLSAGGEEWLPVDPPFYCQRTNVMLNSSGMPRFLCVHPAGYQTTICRPCDPDDMPAYWSFTVSGITAGTCQLCPQVNGDFVLGVNGHCFFWSLPPFEKFIPCWFGNSNVAKGPVWTMQLFGRGTLPGFDWHLTPTGIKTVVGPGTVFYRLDHDLFDCSGSNTFLLADPGDGGCVGFPESITINPLPDFP